MTQEVEETLRLAVEAARKRLAADRTMRQEAEDEREEVERERRLRGPE